MRICVAVFLVAGVAAAGWFVRSGASQPAVVEPLAEVAQPPKDRNPADEDALLKNAEAFVEAFNRGDAKALAAFWTPQGDYTDLTGRRLVGREAIEKNFAEFFAANKGLKLRIEIESLRFPSPDVAIEDGTTAVLTPDGAPPSRARYTVVHVKRDGKWYLDSVRDAAFAPPSNYDHLKNLDWLIGEWADEATEGEAARIAFTWTENQNFVVSHFTVHLKSVPIGGGTQWIGWDPDTKAVRSWMFEANGGHGEGVWTGDGNRWVVKTTTVLPDGKKTTATNTITRVDPDMITWGVTERTLDGKPLADLQPAKMKRVTDPARGK
jgi:uncharacterized protein (TIGR02246 family)